MGSIQCFDEIDELMFDLHTRSCKLGDKQTNEWCDEYKSQLQDKIKEYGTFRAKETADEICKFLTKEKGLTQSVDEIARKYGLIPNKK